MADTKENFVGCFELAPKLYIWMMGNILLFYLALIVVVCYFFRGFFQDPKLEEEERIKELKSRELYEQRQLDRKIAEEIAKGNMGAPLDYTPDDPRGSYSTIKGIVLDEETSRFSMASTKKTK